MSTDGDEYHKAIVLILRKLGILEILITQDDIDQINKLETDARPCAVSFQDADGIHIQIVTAAAARELLETQH